MIARLAVAVILCASVASAGKCEQPQHSASSYSTTDSFFYASTSVIAEFSLKCSNNVREVSFFAVVDDGRRIVQVAHAEETNKYQVSFQLEHAEAGARTIRLAIYDEDGLAAFKKSGSSAKPLFTIDHQHAGLERKWPLSCESVATLVALATLYYVYRLKADLD